MTVIEKLDSDVQAKIEELKRRFDSEIKFGTPCLQSNHTFYRFLKARDFNLNAAEKMLRKHLEWRKEFKVDTILSETIISKDMEVYFANAFLGFDKEQAPVRYFAVGNIDVIGLRKSLKFIDRLKYMIQIMEDEASIQEKQNKKIGKNLSGSVYIYDMKGFSFGSATDKQVIEDLIHFAKVYQDNYPERLKMVVVINISFYFTIAFSIMKKCLAATILGKIHMYGPPEDWQPALQNIIDVNILPAFLGGKKTDPDGDPMCKSFINQGGIVPTKLYIDKSSNSLCKSKDAKRLIIPRASFSEIELDVEKSESVIEWEFEIKTRDIGFGIFLKEKKRGRRRKN